MIRDEPVVMESKYTTFSGVLTHHVALIGLYVVSIYHVSDITVENVVVANSVNGT